MNRAQYDDYITKFNARDYHAVYDFYAENPTISFFGIDISSREKLVAFYSFLHSYVNESITVEAFASTGDFVALEGIVRVEGIQDLTAEILAENGYAGLFPIKKGEAQEMRQYIHYHLENGKITSVGCAIPVP